MDGRGRCRRDLHLDAGYYRWSVVDGLDVRIPTINIDDGRFAFGVGELAA